MQKNGVRFRLTWYLIVIIIFIVILIVMLILTLPSKVKLEDLDKLDKLDKLARCIRQLAEATTLPLGGGLQRYPTYRRFRNDEKIAVCVYYCTFNISEFTASAKFTCWRPTYSPNRKKQARN